MLQAVTVRVSCSSIQNEEKMAAEKTVAVSFRVSQRFKVLLEATAKHEHRSMTNMLESLLFDYCKKQGLDELVPSETSAPSSGATT